MYEFFKNLYIHIFKKSDLKKAEKELDRWKVIIQSEGIHGLRKMMSKFKWKKESSDWTPDDPAIVVMNGWKDDCDGAAVLAKWGFRQLGLSSDFYRLKGSSNHRVCITSDKKWFVSNSSVVEITSPEWRTFVLTWNWHSTKKYTSIQKI